LHKLAWHTWEQMQQQKQSFCTIDNMQLDEIVVNYAREMNTLVSLSHAGHTRSCSLVSLVRQWTHLGIELENIEI
jgi:hypothetical protein